MKHTLYPFLLLNVKTELSQIISVIWCGITITSQYFISNCGLLHSEQRWRVVIAWTWTLKDTDLVTRFGKEVLQSDHWAMCVELVYKQVIKTPCSGAVVGGNFIQGSMGNMSLSLVCLSFCSSYFTIMTWLSRWHTHSLDHSCNYFFQVFCEEIKVFPCVFVYLLLEIFTNFL